MIGIDSDDADVAGMLDTLRQAVDRAGGVQSEAATLRVRAGELSVRADPAAQPGETLLGVPEMLLPDLSNVAIAVQDGRLVLDKPDPDMMATQQAVLEKLLELYNATGKLAAWRATWPFAALGADGELLDRLMARGEVGEAEYGFRIDGPDGSEPALLRSFFDTRVVGLRRHEPGGIRVTPLTLVPLMDCLNHDAFGATAGFGYPEADGPGIALAQLATPRAQSRECFLRYRLLDALESYLAYGFVDSWAPGVLAVADRFALPGGKELVVRRVLKGGASDSAPAEVPAALAAPVAYPDGDTALIDRVLIPGERAAGDAPAALRGLLGWALAPIADGADTGPESTLVRAAEAQVLTATRAFYRALGQALAGAYGQAPAAPPAGRGDALAAVGELLAQQEAFLAAYERQAGTRFAAS